MAAPGTVLIVDDDEAARLLMRKSLERSGLFVEEAADGLAALQVFQQTPADVVLLDVEMPRMDGFDACAALRTLPAGAHVPVMMVTGRDDVGSIMRAYEVGATDFLAKPIPWQLLPYRVRYLMRAGRVRTALERSENRHRALLSSVPDLLLLLDDRGKIVQLHGAHEAQGAFDVSKMLGQMLLEILPPEAVPAARDALAAAARREPVRELEFEFNQNGLSTFFESRFSSYGDGRLLVMLRNVTERRRAADRIRQLAYFDRLTALPNRELFTERLADSVRDSLKSDDRLAVMHFDVDHFKRINDSLGQAGGDALLRAIGKRLVSALRSAGVAGMVARIGGDEFMLFARGTGSVLNAGQIAQRILDEFHEPLSHDDRSVFVTPSIGVAVLPDHGTEAETLLRNSQAAMHAAKAAGRNRVEIFAGSVRLKSLERLELEADLRRSVENGALSLAYQPQVDLRSGKVIGFEALLRWRHPERGMVPPNVFVPLAEESALIVPLSDFVLSSALQQLKAWHAAGQPGLRMAVNLSSAQFTRCRMLEWVTGHLQRLALAPKHLDLEITESVLMFDSEQTTGVLRDLRQLGVHISVDDFGTGYSALSYLKRLTLDTVKIDRSFVADLASDSNDAAICGAIIAMAHRLGFDVVAEGVETESQLEFLREQGCDGAQGYLLAKPMAPEDALNWLVSYRPRPAMGLSSRQVDHMLDRVGSG